MEKIKNPSKKLKKIKKKGSPTGEGNSSRLEVQNGGNKENTNHWRYYRGNRLINQRKHQIQQILNTKQSESGTPWKDET